jgi:hypothetical protein
VHQSACEDELNEIGSPKGSPKHLHLDEFEAITEAGAAGAGLALVELAWQLVGVETCAVTSRLRLAWPAHALENGHVDVRGYTRKWGGAVNRLRSASGQSDVLELTEACRSSCETGLLTSMQR